MDFIQIFEIYIAMMSLVEESLIFHSYWCQWSGNTLSTYIVPVFGLMMGVW